MLVRIGTKVQEVALERSATASHDACAIAGDPRHASTSPRGRRHKAISELRRAYASSWDISSGKFEADGQCAWMASQLTGYNRILEIGTGLGRSTLALLSSGHQVVSTDENLYCLESAKKFLEAAGFPVTIALRGIDRIVTDVGYSVEYEKFVGALEKNSTHLIQGDLF